MAHADAGTDGVDFVQRDFQLPVAADDLRGKGFVEFKIVHVFQCHPGEFQGIVNGRNHAHPHDAGLDGAGGGRHHAGDRFYAQLFRFFSGHHDHAGTGVVQSGSVAGGNGAVFLEGGLEFAQRFHAGIGPGMFVRIKEDRPLFCLDFDGHDFILEPPVLNGGAGPLMTHERPFILLLTGDFIQIGNIIGRDAHVIAQKRVHQAADHQTVLNLLAVVQPVSFAGAKQQIGSVAHAFDAHDRANVDLAQHDFLGKQFGGAHGRGALLMDRKRKGFHRQFRAQRNVPGAVARRAGLVALTGHNFLNQISVNARFGNGGF